MSPEFIVGGEIVAFDGNRGHVAFPVAKRKKALFGHIATQPSSMDVNAHPLVEEEVMAARAIWRGAISWRELDMAVSLVDSMSEDWRPEEFHDDYTEQVHRLIDDKKAGRKVTVEEAPAEPTKVVDLFVPSPAALRPAGHGGAVTASPARHDGPRLRVRRPS